MKTNMKSFTLAELLVVMIITAIVVGMAFSVLRLVQKQIHSIKINYEKSTNLSLFEQKLWQDFNEVTEVKFDKEENKLLLASELDTIQYSFQNHFILRNNDTIKLKLIIDKVLFEGKNKNDGNVDAISISGELELPNYKIFVSKRNDLTLSMNEENGF